MHANITYNMYTQIQPPVNPSYIMPFDSAAAMKIRDWQDKIVPWNFLALEEEAHMHCKMLAREEAADMQVNQERMQEAWNRRTRTRLGDEDA